MVKSDDRTGLVLPVIKSPSDIKGQITQKGVCSSLVIMNNAKAAICQNLCPSKSYFAFQLGHQQVAASTVEVSGTAVAEMPKVTGNQSFHHPLIFNIFVI